MCHEQCNGCHPRSIARGAFACGAFARGGGLPRPWFRGRGVGGARGHRTCGQGCERGAPAVRRFVGHEAKVRIGEPLDGRRNFTGVIERAGEDAFVLRLSEGAEVELPFGSVTRANLKEDIYK